MFFAVYRNELKRSVKALSFAVSFGVLFLIVFANVSDTTPGRTIVFEYGQKSHNSPLLMARFMAILTALGVLFSVMTVARSVARDFSARVHDFYFTAPLSKGAYLGGRFCAGLSANILLYLSIVLATVLACLMIDPKFRGPMTAGPIIFEILVILIPNLLLMGSIFFAVATLTRQMVTAYVTATAFLMAYGMVAVASVRAEISTLAIFMDPFGIAAITDITKYWTIAEINSRMIPLTLTLVLNRLLWLGVSALTLAFTYHRFKFVSVPQSGRKRSLQKEKPLLDKGTPIREAIPVVTLANSPLFNLRRCMSMAGREFRRVALHPAFILITLLALLQVHANFTLDDGWSAIKYPVTSRYLECVGDLYVYVLAITVIFSGVLVWRQRDLQMNEFHDTLPLPDWIGCLGKLMAMMGIHTLIALLVMGLGMFTQVVVYGYTQVEPLLYLKWLFGIHLISYWHLAVLFIFIQNLVSQKYVGYMICSAYAVAAILIPEYADKDISLLTYGQLPKFIYSNLNGFGHHAVALIWYRVYWLLGAIVLVMLSNVLWRRDNETGLVSRLRAAWQKRSRCFSLSFTGAVSLMALVGAFIYYHNHILNEYVSPQQEELRKLVYETQYKQLEHNPQPTVTDVNLAVDLFPAQRAALIKGRFVLENNTDQSIQDIHVNLSERKITQINALTLSADAELTRHDRETGFRTYTLAQALEPGTHTELSFDFEVFPRGFSVNNARDALAHNGSFIFNLSFFSPNYFPQIGYNKNRELGNPQQRAHYGLEVRKKLPLEEANEQTQSFGNVITYEAVISTSASQLAVTNGDLQRQWTQDERKYFHYKTRHPMNHAIVIHSGKFAVAREHHKGVDIEVYYNAKHPHNVQSLINGTKAAYDYCTQNFSPYPHGALRIVEVPHIKSFGSIAFSLPTVFTWTESSGFIHDIEASEAAGNFDYVFSTSAHEMAHQWWAHDVMPADTEGMGFMAETTAMWVQVMCMERQFPPEVLQRYLRGERLGYLRNRGDEPDRERPLMREHEQDYLYYSKGVLAMYALKAYIGEDAVNQALRQIVERFGLQGERKSTTLDFVAALREVTPVEYQYLITDLFETITLHENRALDASYTELEDGRYKVNLHVASKKFRADGLGQESEIALNDLIDIAVLGENGPLYQKRHKLTQSEHGFGIIVDEAPVQAGIDPDCLLIDRNIKDNLVAVSHQPSAFSDQLAKN
jgi:ABC-2 type transport system permease protein